MLILKGENNDAIIKIVKLKQFSHIFVLCFHYLSCSASFISQQSIGVSLILCRWSVLFNCKRLIQLSTDHRVIFYGIQDIVMDIKFKTLHKSTVVQALGPLMNICLLVILCRVVMCRLCKSVFIGKGSITNMCKPFYLHMESNLILGK